MILFTSILVPIFWAIARDSIPSEFGSKVKQGLDRSDIASYSPRGGVDLLARIVGGKLTEAWGVIGRAEPGQNRLSGWLE
jgi:hypothetical protein